MQIWPAIDILDGQCVRLIQGDYGQKTVYGKFPSDMASRWVADGAKCLHLVDLNGARNGSNINRQAVQEIVSAVEIDCQLGGGIREEETIRDYLNIGVKRLVIGTRAHKDPVWFRSMCEKFPQRLLVGIDARDGMVATDGWTTTTNQSAKELAQQFARNPIAGLVFTDISRDGMMSGPNLDALKDIIQSVDVPVIASGGVTTIDDVKNLTHLGIVGCIIGKSLYEGKLTLAEAIRASHAELNGSSA
jgi:phosphoribosylformimino-5-aminoimidazole carboxamide ribotide isomerase